METKNFKVGQVWVARDGSTVTITRTDCGGAQPIEADSDADGAVRYYNRDGSFFDYEKDGTVNESVNDLIGLVSDVESESKLVTKGVKPPISPALADILRDSLSNAARSAESIAAKIEYTQGALNALLLSKLETDALISEIQAMLDENENI